jgi:hypothetical protein
MRGESPLSCWMLPLFDPAKRVPSEHKRAMRVAVSALQGTRHCEDEVSYHYVLLPGSIQPVPKDHAHGIY